MYAVLKKALWQGLLEFYEDSWECRSSVGVVRCEIKEHLKDQVPMKDFKFNPIYHVSVDHQHKLCYC